MGISLELFMGAFIQFLRIKLLTWDNIVIEGPC